MTERAERFSEEVRALAGKRLQALEDIEEVLAYCQSIPETSVVKDWDQPGRFKESVAHRLQVFGHSSLRRMEQLILGLISETNSLRLVTLARSVFESGASVYYGYKMVSAHKRNGHHDAIDACLTRLILGAVKFKNPSPWGSPISVDAAISKLGEEHKDDALRDQYTWLSDFVHPNGPALSFFHQVLDKPTKTMHFKKKMPLNESWIFQIHFPASYAALAAKEGWEWMLGFKWKDRRTR